MRHEAATPLDGEAQVLCAICHGPASLRPAGEQRQVARIQVNHATGKISGGVARERDQFDVMPMAIEELLGDFRGVSLHPSEALQRLEGDAAANFDAAVTYREVDGAPYSVRNAADKRRVMHHDRSSSRGRRLFRPNAGEPRVLPLPEPLKGSEDTGASQACPQERPAAVIPVTQRRI